MATGEATSSASKSPESDSLPDERTPTGWYRFWKKELDAAFKRMKTFHQQGVKVNERFLGTLGSNDQITRRLPLFHTNISTLQSMLYGSTPRVEVTREHHDPDDDIARVASVLFQRILQADIEPSGEDMPTVLKAALQDRLLPGLGVARVRYDFATAKVTQLDPLTGTSKEVEMVSYEDAPVDYVHWQDTAWGWCRTWDEMPWFAFRSYLDRDEATQRFGETKAKELEYKNQSPTNVADADNDVEADQKNNVRKAEIWEIWNKKDSRVYWFCDGADIILDAADDPLKLDGFWPMPRPMMANVTTTQMIPVADYVISQDLYNQVDELNTRIVMITKAIKVVGVYDGSAVGVKRMLVEGMENDLIPVDNWAMFAEKGGLKGVIDWFPVQDVVGVLQILQQVMDTTINMLYQVTGMSDLLRGANTDQYVSDGTNQLTAKFGSIRVQALQDEFARFASDLEALKTEVISKHFEAKSILRMSGAQFLPEPDRPLAMPAVQLMKSADVKWRVSIRPESIAMVDYAQLKAERTEFLMAMATYIQSAQAAAKEMPGSLPVLLELLKWGMAGFKGADYLEGIMDQAIDAAKKAPPGGKDDGKAQAEQVKMQGEMQKLQAQSQADMQKIQAKAQADQQAIQQKFQLEMQREQQKNQHKLEQDMSGLRAELQKISANLMADLKVIAEKLNADIAIERTQSTYAVAETESEHLLGIQLEDRQHAHAMEQMEEQNEAPESNEENDG